MYVVVNRKEYSLADGCDRAFDTLIAAEHAAKLWGMTGPDYRVIRLSIIPESCVLGWQSDEEIEAATQGITF